MQALTTTNMRSCCQNWIDQYNQAQEKESDGQRGLTRFDNLWPTGQRQEAFTNICETACNQQHSQSTRKKALSYLFELFSQFGTTWSANRISHLLNDPTTNTEVILLPPLDFFFPLSPLTRPIDPQLNNWQCAPDNLESHLGVV